MDTKEVIRIALQEFILPEMGKIKDQTLQIQAALEGTNKRLDDISAHLVDQSRRIDETNKRIDAVREDLLSRIDETNKRIDETNKRIDETNKRIGIQGEQLSSRIDKVHADLIGRSDRFHADMIARIDKVHTDLIGRMDSVTAELTRRFDQNNQRTDTIQHSLGVRIDETNAHINRFIGMQGLQNTTINERLDRLREGLVRIDDHLKVEERVTVLERAVQDLSQRVAV